MLQTACISHEQLRDFSLGRVSAEEEVRIAEHLDQCESCQQAAAECDRSADSLVAALRLPDDAPSDDDVHCDAALLRAKQLAAGSVDGRHDRTEPIRLREYELLRKLGEGGMGTVYLARHTRLDRIVALKILPPDRMRDSSAVARFEREMRAVGGLDHPAIVRATDAGDVDGTHFLVMEYVEGLDLSSLVERLGPIGIADACELVRQAALGLQHVHERGMVHRDIKPSNLMLTPRGEVKILDLGLALLQRGDGELQGITTVGRFMGTLDYMAPEQADDSHEVDIRADVYGLGATLYRLICGVPPFAGKEYRSPLKKLKALATEPVPPVRERRPEVPAPLAQIVERMLAKEPADRFATPVEVAEALQPFAAASDLAKLQREAESRQLAPQVGRSLAEQVNGSQRNGPAVEHARRSRWYLAVLLLALAGLIAAAVVYVETDKGTLVIKSPDPGLKVLIRRGGEPVDGLELHRGENRTTVRSGRYEIVLIGETDGLRVKDRTFTLTRGGEHVAVVERVGSGGNSIPMPPKPQPNQPAGDMPGSVSDRQALQGTWKAVWVRTRLQDEEEFGDVLQRFRMEDIPNEPNDVPDLTIRFGLDEFIVWEGKTVEARGPYVLLPAERPKTIIFVRTYSELKASTEREISVGMYELHGDRLLLAISKGGPPTPRFKPDQDTDVLVLRRVDGERTLATSPPAPPPPDLSAPTQAEPAEARLWNEFGVTPKPVAPLTARLLEWMGLHLAPIGRNQFREKNVFADYPGGLDVRFCRTGGPAEKAGIHESGIIVGLQGRQTMSLEDLDSAMKYAVEQIERGEADSLQFQMLLWGKTGRIEMQLPPQVREMLLHSRGEKSAPVERKPEPTYDGRTFDEWLQVLRTERKLDSVTKAMRAVAVLSDGERAGDAADAILNQRQ